MKLLTTNKQHQLAERIIKNYLIGKTALNNAFADGKNEAYFLAIDILTDNTVSSLVDIVGIEGTKYFTNKYRLGTVYKNL